MELTVNTLLEWVKEENAARARVERVLFSVPVTGDLAVIALFDEAAQPFWRARAELEESFAEGRVRRLEIDPYATLLRPDDVLKQSHRERREAAWAIIAPIIEIGTDAFQRKRRGPLIAEISKRAKCSKRMIYWYLRRYWQAGQTINALLPNFDRCGGRGKDRKTKSLFTNDGSRRGTLLHSGRLRA